MLGGHYTTALIAHQKFPKGKLVYFLFMSQLPDLLWVVFHFLGLEETQPIDIAAVSLDNLIVDMTYSHDLLPILFWMGMAYLLAIVFFKDKKVGLAGATLILVHAVVDYIGGYPHNLFGTDTASIGTGLYYTYPYLSVLLEAIFSFVMLFWFFAKEKKEQQKRSKSSRNWIIGIFSFNIVFMFSIADLSMYEYLEPLGVELPQFSVETTVPSLIVMYLAYIYLINKVVSRKGRHEVK